MQIFTDLLGGEWHTAPANPVSDAFWVRQIGSTILVLARHCGGSYYALLGMEGSPPPVAHALGGYDTEPGAVNGLTTWVNYLASGGTIAAWHVQYPRGEELGALTSHKRRNRNGENQK